MAPAVTGSVLQATPDAAIAKGGILHHAFPGNTWGRWLAVLRAAWGIKLSPEDESLFREIAGGRSPPMAKVRELWVLAGRRSGKDAAASAILATTALQNWNPFLRPGERASCVCLASTVEQAQIINRYVRSYFEQGPLARFVTAQTDDVLQLSTGAEIIIAAGNFRSIRGKAVAIAVLDEICFWRGTDAANSDVELLAALTPALETLPGSMLVGISSPFKRSGVAYEKWARHFGKDNPDVLVLHGETRQFNPTVRQATVDAALESDPDRAAAEWLGRWRDFAGTFIDRQLVDSAVEPGVAARAPQFDAEFSMFVDASGGRGSSFCACVAHTEGEVVYIDALFERRPPCDPQAVVAEVAALAREYRVGTVRGDRFSGNWVSEAFAKEGIVYISSELDKSQLFLNTLPLFTSGKIRLLDNPRMSHQFTQLERRVTKTGRDIVTAPSGAADDLANACAGAAVNAVTDGPALVRSASVFAQATPIPVRAQAVYSITAIGQDGMIATAFFALNRLAAGWIADECVLLDATLEPLTLDMTPRIFKRLAELRELFTKGNPIRRAYFPKALEGAFHGSISRYIDVTAAHLSAADSAVIAMDIEPYDETAHHDLPTLVVQFSTLQHSGLFKITEDVVAKSRTLPLASALSFRPNEKIEDSTLRIAILEGVKMGLLA